MCGQHNNVDLGLGGKQSRHLFNSGTHTVTVSIPSAGIFCAASL